MPESVEKRLAALPGMSKKDLCQLWQKVFATEPSPKIQKPLLIRILAYRIQEQAFGGLSAATHNRLLALARRLKANPKVNLLGKPKISPGTRLIRQWRDRTHVVTVGDNSYEYQGLQYKSLSEIAGLITGTKWSGPLFFGLKDQTQGKGREINK